MKKKFLVGLVTGLSMVYMVSMASATSYVGYMNSVTTAADAMVAAQNNDGSFDWENDGDPTDSGPNNTQGATVRGLLAAYKTTGNTAYLDAANKNADWIIANNPSGMYNKDVIFLYELAAAGGTDYTTEAAASAITYINDNISQTGAVTGADAVYKRYEDAGTLDGLKYWMIGEWGDVGRLLGDIEIYAGYTGDDMAQGIGTLLNDDFLTYSADLSVDPYETDSTLGFVGILEGLEAGIGSGGTYTNTQNVIDTLANRVETGIGTDGWQSLGYATYALSLFDDEASLTGRDVLAEWITDGYFYTGTDAYLESMGEALLGLSSAAAPVPEPATMLLFGTGIAGLAGGSRIRRKKKASST